MPSLQTHEKNLHLRSAAIGSGFSFVISNYGQLWYWNNLRFPFHPKEYIDDNLPFFVSVVANGHLILLDECGDVWCSFLQGNSIKLKQHESLSNIRSIHVDSSNNDPHSIFYALDFEGTVWKATFDSKFKIENIPLLDYFSVGPSYSSGIDITGKVWTWKNTRKLIQISVNQALATYPEKESIKILTKDGKIWKYFIEDELLERMFSQFDNLPPFVCMNVSGQHSIAIDENGEAWGWGFNSSGELGLVNTSFIWNPTKIPDIPLLHSTVCGQGRSILIGQDGELMILKNGLKRIKEVPQVFIRKSTAKSARK